MLLYSGRQIEIWTMMDDQGECPLTYWYEVLECERGGSAEVDVRTLPAFKDYFKGKKPEHMDFFMNKKKYVSAIIRLAVKRGEIGFRYQPAYTPEDK